MLAQVIVEDMEGNGDSFNVALSGETSVVFELSNVNDESPQIDPLTTQVQLWEKCVAVYCTVLLVSIYYVCLS